ncbi:arginase [Aneurinibacillus soli]|uniref:Arginase n=1 Tax=Aneurinibacillus soli TaxID=1500254 RepID=A0A0U4WB09_9BACL|nr:arginase [Aneurinibacillus soli]PYE58926.1 arginase [Aneurinibacillus soli]BAU26059.1 Arginase [Aneurinibacillus soli]
MNPTLNPNVSLIGVPMDLGADRRGVDMGPSAIRYAGIEARLEALGYVVHDEGDIIVQRPKQQATPGTHLKYLDEIARVNQELCEAVSFQMGKGRFPLVIGGDHSIAIGTIAGVLQHRPNTGVIWFDAHGDMNTADTSPSGNIHGMSLAVSLGYGHERLTEIGGIDQKLMPENVVLIGARALDPGEKRFIQERGIKVFTMHEIDRLGMARVMEEALQIVTARTDGVHLSLDLDGLDPHDCPGVGTPVIGGINYRESHLAMEILAEAGVLTSAEFVEVNPILDRMNQTARVAVGLMGSVFGEKLL